MPVAVAGSPRPGTGERTAESGVTLPDVQIRKGQCGSPEIPPTHVRAPPLPQGLSAHQALVFWELGKYLWATRLAFMLI